MNLFCKKVEINAKIWFKNIDGDVKKISKSFQTKLKNLNLKLQFY